MNQFLLAQEERPKVYPLGTPRPPRRRDRRNWPYPKGLQAISPHRFVARRQRSLGFNFLLAPRAATKWHATRREGSFEIGSDSRKGVSLIEALIGVVVGGILIASGVGLINVALKSTLQNKYLQSASFLGSELISKVSVYADRRWYCPPGCTVESGGTPANYGIYNLTKGSGNNYYLDPVKSPFEWVVPVSPAIGETVTVPAVGGIPYTRYFYVENVFRDTTTGNIVTSGGTEDPSTQKVTAVVVWPGGGQIQNVKYLTRNRNEVVQQTDWSGGVDTTTAFPVGTMINKYSQVTNIDVTTIPGSIKIQGL